MHEYLKHSNLGLEQRSQGDDGGGSGGVQFLISNFERLWSSQLLSGKSFHRDTDSKVYFLDLDKLIKTNSNSNILTFHVI